MPSLTRGLPERTDPYVLPAIDVSAWMGGDLRATGDAGDARLAAFPALWQAALRRLVDALALNLGADRPLAGLFGAESSRP
jgi:hypothetical protein